MTTGATLTVGQLHEQLTAALRAAFPHEVWIAGEVVGKRTAPSGHTYLDLVERPAPGAQPTAAVKVVCYRQNLEVVRRTLRGTGVTVTDGVEIRIRARVTVYRGQLQVTMSGIDPTYTLGRIAADRDALLRTLAAEGLLEVNRSRRLPAAPLRVGLVTSVDSAAYHDFTDELARSGFAFQVLAVDTRVQGEAAPASITAAIAGLSARTADSRWAPDVVVVIRGGGSRTDLAAFDTEPVVRAIVGCPVPVLTGIGHETDRAVADDVAHTSFKTPTACAQHLIGVVTVAAESAERLLADVTAAADRQLAEARTRLDGAAGTLARTGDARLTRAAERLTAAAERIARAGGDTLIRRAEEVDRATTRLGREAPRTLERHAASLAVAAATVTANDPARVLARGYSITRDSSGHVITDPGALRPGDRLRTELAAGAVTSTVATSVIADRPDATPFTPPDPAADPGDGPTDFLPEDSRS